MKNLKYILLVSTFVFVFGCKQAEPEVKTVETASEMKEIAMDPNAKYAKAEFTIDGMTCAVGCAKTIEKKLAGMDGVQSATVDFDKKLAMVVYNEAKVNPESLTETVSTVGDAYKVSDMKTEGYTTEKKASCKPGCKMDAKAEASASSEKPAGCKKDCKMACCAGKA